MELSSKKQQTTTTNPLTLVKYTQHHKSRHDVQDFVNFSMNKIPDLKVRLRRETHEKLVDDAIMLTEIDQCEHMQFIIKLAKAKKGLELGVFTGYSALSFAEALPDDGLLIAVDVNKEWTDLGKKYWKEAGVDHKIQLRLEGGDIVLNELLADESNIDTFDFAFVDADKPNYPNYYDRIIKLLKPNGFLMIDNTIWNGKTTDETLRNSDENARCIWKTVQMALNDERVDVHSIYLSDGLTIVQKK
ncbi:o-methyltransferase [Stylonychia lemnae]|uniref:O-methyltransferase n=1 Tax=Stylonychia lemnae TaxID=5949 RepID=A0A078ARK5_STYLE|nr:o-methyltransferase [Stylonychia lemnae]|eukprot:CDW85100.1 o-methyltransferase [Stylonychia lemnae]